MPHRADALAILEHAISNAGGAKVMLRLDEALAIRGVLRGEPAPVCDLIAEGRPCVCNFTDPDCAHRRAG